METLLHILPQIYTGKLCAANMDQLEEIRLRVGQPLLLRYSYSERMVTPRLSALDLEETLRRACKHSVYACGEEIRCGFITLEGGHRMGICGQGVMQNAQLHTIKNISSMNIRIARSVAGFADRVRTMPKGSTIILGPPGSGKTTLLRALIVKLSDCWGQTVALADERGEVAAASEGVPRLYTGKRTDVMSHVPKSEAVMLMLRAMAPQWIAVDEITAPNDIASIEYACHCGIHLLATAHAETTEDLLRRPLYQELMKRQIFTDAIVLKQGRTYEMERIGQ